MTAPPDVRGLVAERLEVVREGRTLLAPSTFRVRPGELAVVSGPSGAGKSLLLDLVIGAVGPGARGVALRGRLRLDGTDLLEAGIPGRAGRVGAVFQSHRSGLFDDLTVGQNLRFGGAPPAEVDATATRLGLDGALRDTRGWRLSGGQRVRATLARTLLAPGDVLLYDEPTTGQDARGSRAVAEEIRSAHASRPGAISLVVTHDLDAFADAADAWLFVDPVTREVVRLEPGPETLARVRAATLAGAPDPPPAPPAKRPWTARIARRLDRLVQGLGRAAEEVGVAFAFPRAAADLFHPLHGPRVRQSLRRTFGGGVAAFVGTGVGLIALTITWFLFARLPRRTFAEPLVQEDLVTGLGVVLARVVVPLMASVLLAAKLGASAAAHLGHMAWTRQVDALVLLRVSPRRHLLLPLAGAQVLAFWAHTLLATFLAFVAALLVFLWDHPGWSLLYFREAWFRDLEAADLLWTAAKVGACAVLVAAAAYRRGTAPKAREEDVVRAIHGTLLEGLLLVVATHALFAFLEF